MEPRDDRREWVDGATGPAVGAKFRGTNKLGPFKWSTTPTITEFEPDKVFAFDAGGTEWRYSFTEADGGTSVTESFRVNSTISASSTRCRRAATDAHQGHAAKRWNGSSGG